MSQFLTFQDENISDPREIIFEMTKDERKDFYRTIARGLQRPLFSVYRRVTRMYDQKNHMGKYTQDEIKKLREYVAHLFWRVSLCVFFLSFQHMQRLVKNVNACHHDKPNGAFQLMHMQC